MLFKQYLDEAYTSEMSEVLGKYRKDIGDWFASQGYSVQRINFEEVPLDKSLALNSLFKKYDNPILSFINDLVLNNKGGFRRFFAICKHKTQGVTVYTREISSPSDVKIDRDGDIFDFGDTSSKVSRVFVGFSRRGNESDVNVGGLRHAREMTRLASRDRNQLNKPYLNLITALNNNPICKEIRSRARSIGFKDFQLYSLNNYLSIENESIYINCGSSERFIIINIDDSKWGEYKSNDNLNLKCNISFSGVSCTVRDQGKIDDIAEAYTTGVDKLQKVYDFVEYLNTLTIEDVLIEYDKYSEQD